jgi:hypothetical protein
MAKGSGVVGTPIGDGGLRAEKGARAVALISAAISVLGLLVATKYAVIVGGRARTEIAQAHQELAQAQRQTESATQEAKTIQAKATKTLDSVIGSYESIGRDVEVVSPEAKHTGFVYLGVCDGTAWTKAYFANLPTCSDGPLAQAIAVKSLRDMKVRAVASSESGVGKEIARIHRDRTFKLIAMNSMSPAAVNGPQIVWGEVELPPAGN